jgi:RHS repeat-associated protein
VISELNSSGGGNRSEIYAGGRHKTTCVSNTTYFAHADWLGTERARTDPTGAVAETCQSLPFGDGLSCTGASDISFMHFTGKEHDTESNLDYFGARYYNSSLGRFVTPDPGNAGADESDPQSWNAYSYVQNNPPSATDPDGLDCVFVSSGGNGVGSINQGLGSEACSDVGGYYVPGTLTDFSIDKGGNYVFTSVTGPNASDLTQHTTTVAPVDELDVSSRAIFSQLDKMPIQKFIFTTEGASALIGLTGGVACYYLCPEAGITTLGLEEAGGAATGSEEVGLTEHAAQRLAERGISKAQVQDAIRTAKEAGRVTSKLGKYGTPQEIYQGSNGITVVIETAGRNAGKVITAFFH